MGFFDELVKEAKQSLLTEHLKAEIRKQYNIHVERSRELKVTGNYKIDLISFKENSIKEFQDFFQGKGFEVSSTEQQFSSSLGYKATLGRLEINFTYLRHNVYEIKFLPYLTELLIIKDLNEVEGNFKGFLNLYNKEIILFGDNGKDDEVFYQKVLEDLKKDIEIYDEKIQTDYKPQLAIYIQRNDKYVLSIKEYLELLDREMEQIKYDFIYNSTYK